MANEELNKNENNDSILGLESDSLDELGKISAEELEKFGSDLKDFNDEPKPKAEQAAEEASEEAEKPAEAAETDGTEPVKLADLIGNKSDKGEKDGKGAGGRPAGPNGQRRRRLKDQMVRDPVRTVRDHVRTDSVSVRTDKGPALAVQTLPTDADPIPQDKDLKVRRMHRARKKAGPRRKKLCLSRS